MTAAKPKTATIKLDPGTDLVGNVKFITYYPQKDNPDKPGEKFAAQWGLAGEWGQAGSGRVYVDAYQLQGGNPISQGFAKQDGEWGDGSPRFKWTGQGAFRLHKFVKDKKHYVTLTADGGAVPAQVGNGAPNTAQAGRSTVASPSPAPSSPIEAWWDEQRTLMQHCWKLAQQIHGAGEGVMTEGWLEQGVAATAHSFYIQANREGKLAPPTTTEAIRNTLDSFAGMPPQLKEGPPDPELPEWMR